MKTLNFKGAKTLDVLSVIALALFALFSNLKLFEQEFNINQDNIGLDSVSMYEEKIKGVRKILPAYGVIGYVTEREYKGGALSADEAMMYFLTQYVLSPVIVVNGTEYDFVIGNFYKTGVQPAFLRNKNLTVYIVFKNGIVFYKTEAR